MALDSRAGWMAGGEGGPIVVPGRPEESRLIKAVRWSDDEVHMPPKQKLSDSEVALLVTWVRRGAPDPRDSNSPAQSSGENSSWEAIYRQRLKWWSLQPVRRPPLPPLKKDGQSQAWCRTDIDRFILSRLEAEGLMPAAEADRWTLARRLTFALTGLPPKPEDVERFVSDPSPDAYEKLVDALLQSVHFGEHWARHWMDVVHYADTHGYEWDIPAKHAWRYRDYLIRALNDDVPYRQLVQEHLAGDLIEPRVNPRMGINESLIGPMALRLGERRHGDNGEFDGITQEAMDNVIDTVGKAFLGTTVACARCHDHKLDALAQRDYYAWAGILMSSRWATRTVNASDPNTAAIAELRQIKNDLRRVLAQEWLSSIDSLEEPAKAVLTGVPSRTGVPRIAGAPSWKALLDPGSSAPEDPRFILHELAQSLRRGENVAVEWKKLAADYHSRRDARLAANRRCRLLADFTKGKVPEGWSVDGLGLLSGFALDGDFVVSDEGPTVLRHILPAGIYSHLYSPRLQGAVRSPLWTHGEGLLSLEVVGGGFASARPIVDHALFPEFAVYLDRPFPTWLRTSTRVTPATASRRIYFEIVTKGLNNNFPARVDLIKGTPQALADERSWFGVTRVYAGDPPQDELGRFTALFEGPPPASPAQVARRFRDWLRTAVEHWREERSDAEDVVLLNWMLRERLLPNSKESKTLADLVARYRAIQATIKPDVTVGSIADVAEGHDERIGIRGSYSDLGDLVPRGNIRFLAAYGPAVPAGKSGRLALARCIASPDNPLTARVFVNRVWSSLFGTGLVRTVDDFGHLGEKPSHPELLDFLARQFMDDGWSIKKLVRRIVCSSTWRQSGDASREALLEDPENRLWHHYPLRRLEGEEIRDAILATSGRLDPSCFGPPVDPFRHSEDRMKRLFSGPVDGNGRRSIYIKMTLMEPAKFLAEFNQPLPKLTVGHRDVTNVPSQALTLLNDPFVLSQAKFWAQDRVLHAAKSPDERIDAMLFRAFGRRPSAEERLRFEKFVRQIAQLRSVKGEDVLQSVPVWQDVAHAIFNVTEFIYVR